MATRQNTTDTDLVVVKLNTARLALSQAKTIQDAKQVIDIAAAMEVYAKRQQLGQDAIDYAHAIKIEALRRVGELLQATDRNTGVRVRGGTTGGPIVEPPAKDAPPTLAELGIDKKLSSLAQKLADLPVQQFEQVAEGVTSVAAAIREVKKEQAAAALADAQAHVTKAKRAALSSVCDLRVCSCATLLASGVRPDAVITDPPYPQEFLPVFSELAKACAAAKVPLVAVMSGQSYLPEVMARLCEHLDYRWTLAYLTPGGQAVQQWEAKVNAAWKPVLVFGPSREWFGDVATSKPNDNDKRFHNWGQSESGMADLVERLTKPGQLVCDPFLGGGTTAVVALALGRRFVGCDISAAAVATAQSRVETMDA